MNNENNALATVDTNLVAQAERSLAVGLEGLVRDAEVVMFLIDTSGSMCGEPIDNLRKVVREVNPQGNGVSMIAFGGPYDAEVRFVDSVPDAAGGTPLDVAIPYAKEYGATRLVVVSDGMPNLREETLRAARDFGGRIDVVYVGVGGDMGSQFLEELAHITGGKRTEGDISDPKQIAGKVMLALEGEVEPAHVPLQGAGFATVAAPDVDDEEGDDDDDADPVDDD